MKVAHFQFDEKLGALILRGGPRTDFEHRFNGPQSLKHLAESLGIPHTELGVIEANGSPVPSNYLVQDGDLLEIRSVQAVEEFKVEPRFVLDGHLGRLAHHLRMLGLDCLYQNDYGDLELARISVEQLRTLLTRDRRLLMRKSVTHGYLVRSLDSRAQLEEVVHRFRLIPWIKPFRRCIRCNHPLDSVRKEEIIERLEPLTRLYFEEFRICPACRQIYWKGSHFDKMQRLISALMQSGG